MTSKPRADVIKPITTLHAVTEQHSVVNNGVPTKSGSALANVTSGSSQPTTSNLTTSGSLPNATAAAVTAAETAPATNNNPSSTSYASSTNVKVTGEALTSITACDAPKVGGGAGPRPAPPSGTAGHEHDWWRFPFSPYPLDDYYRQVAQKANTANKKFREEDMDAEDDEDEEDDIHLFGMIWIMLRPCSEL